MKGVWVVEGQVVEFEEAYDFLYNRYEDSDSFYEWVNNNYDIATLMEYYKNYDGNATEATNYLFTSFLEEEIEMIAQDSDFNADCFFIPYKKQN